MRGAIGIGILSLGLWAASSAVLLAADTPKVAEADDAKIQSLIEQLGDESYQIREEARQRLTDIGPAASDALCNALDHTDPEIASQASYLLRGLQLGLINEGAYPAAKAFLANFHVRPHVERIRRIRELAYLDDDCNLTIWSRLARYAVDEREAKAAALEMIRLPWNWDDKTGIVRQAALQKLVPESKRSAVRWVRAYAAVMTDPTKRAEQFGEFAAAESKLLETAPERTSPTIVQRLLRLQIDALEAAGRVGETAALVGQMVELESGEPPSLFPLQRFLLDRQDYARLGQLTKRLEAELETNPVAFYYLAEAERAQNHAAAAAELAEKAAKAHGSTPLESLVVAEQLTNLGLDVYADEVYRKCIEDAKGMDPVLAALISISYSEHLHDRGRDDEAASTRFPIAAYLATFKEKSAERYLASANEYQFDLKEFRARTYYYVACARERQHDAPGQLNSLHAALNELPTDEDSLIMLYHLPKLADVDRKLLKDSLPRAIKKNREKLSNSDKGISYNQFAWIVGNTEGDMDEAINLGQLAVNEKIKYVLIGAEDEWPKVGGVYDTLAHCYAGKGDFAKAASTQSVAHRLDPYSQQIKHKLDYFMSEAEKQPKK
jgi:hypothetical protein